jgi:hypothetical protein
MASWQLAALCFESVIGIAVGVVNDDVARDEEALPCCCDSEVHERSICSKAHVMTVCCTPDDAMSRGSCIEATASLPDGLHPWMLPNYEEEIEASC